MTTKITFLELLIAVIAMVGLHLSDLNLEVIF